MSVRSIAKQLGVSPTAVSLALRESSRVSPTLREAVRKLARSERYAPNARLRELMHEVQRARTPAYRSTLAALSLFPEQEPWKAGFPHLGTFLEGARRRAGTHGYVVEYFWLKRPGLTPGRLRSILEARGIKGVLSLGSRDPEEAFPAELRDFSVVTFAASIPTPLHRVASNFTADARALLAQLERRRYRRPGLVILHSGDRRTNFGYSEAFLGWQERRTDGPALPILRAETWDEAQFAAWFRAHRPDVLVLHQHAPYHAALADFLRRERIRVPRDLGLALLDLNPDPARLSGVRQDFALMGAISAEVLIGRVLLGDRGEPSTPKYEAVPGRWNEGRTLRAAPRSGLV